MHNGGVDVRTGSRKHGEQSVTRPMKKHTLLR
jgi:hypothetical protein